jgi:hypothetical protein
MIYSYYRLSDKPALKPKNKPEYINNEHCLRNFLSCFGPEGLHLIADTVGDDTRTMVISLARNYGFSYEFVEYESGSRTFLHSFQKACLHDEDDIVYFVEDDFLHVPGCRPILLEAFDQTKADYVTLYDHPDKYTNRRNGGSNPFIKHGGEKTRVLKTDSTHWKQTNSTVMTFAARVRTLLEDEKVWRRCVSGDLPRSFTAFKKLCKRGLYVLNIFKSGRILISPIPGRSTHGECEFLSPFVKWDVL